MNQAVLVVRSKKYLLDDEFLDTRSAGAVNSTPATPGPGVRAAQETDGQFSVSGGTLVVTAQATPAWGDLDLQYGATPRATGRVVLFRFNLTTISNCEIGWCTDADFTGPTTDVDAGVDISSNSIQARFNGQASLTVASIVAGTVYTLGISLRPTGAYYFVKGGAFTNWTLLWMSSINATATLYPLIGNYASVGSVDFLRVPVALWLPAPLAYDTFARANGALGSSETVGPDGQSTGQLAWTDQIGTWQVASNAANCSALSGGIGIATIPADKADVIVDAAVTRTAGSGGVVCRYAANNYIYAVHDGTNAILVKVVGGTPTTLISAAATYVAGAILRVILDGSSVSLYYNNAQVGATQTVNDAGIINNTLHGLYVTSTNPTLDNFLVLPRGTNGEHNRLDTWSGVNP